MGSELGIRIYLIRGQPVILDQDLAKLYDVTTKALNQAVKRNIGRFPEEFLFQLVDSEWEILRSQIVTLKTGGSGAHRKYRPWVFTEHGALMSAMVLNSAEATAMSVFIIRAFVRQREALAANQAILKRLAEIDQSLLVHDAALRDLYHKLLPLLQLAPRYAPAQRRISMRWYIQLTQAEAAFRTAKSDIGLRPVAKPDPDVATLLAHLGLNLPKGSKIVENVVEKIGA